MKYPATPGRARYQGFSGIFYDTEGPVPLESFRQANSNGVGLGIGPKNRPMAPNLPGLVEILAIALAGLPDLS